jgi:hypothetical protein
MTKRGLNVVNWILHKLPATGTFFLQRSARKLATSVVALALATPTVQAQIQWIPELTEGLSISTVMTLNMGAGEVQSTVVRPGLKAECPNGRFLASSDRALRRADAKPIENGAVMGRDLDKSSGPVVSATFESPPFVGDRYHTNDHDLVVLANGDVLLVDTTASRKDMNPKPAWWNYAYRYSEKTGKAFGPGARSSMLIYHSSDCGQTFDFRAEVDSAMELDGSCANPQFAHGLPTTTGPGTPENPVFDMGGTDGPLTRLDVKTGVLYMSHQCAGYKPQAGTASESFSLSNSKMNKSLILASYNSGIGWATLGFSPWARWRSNIVPLSANKLIFGLRDGVYVGQQMNSGQWQFDPILLLVANYEDPNDIKTEINDVKDKYGEIVSTNVPDPRALTRVPGSLTKVLAAMPATMDQGPDQGHGYRLFVYDTESHQRYELDPVMPKSNSLNAFLLHLTAIDIGEGPVFLYWTDIDMNTQSATIRGRLVLSDIHSTSDFQVSRTVSSKEVYLPNWIHSWPVNTGYWYGDYQTGWGYREPTPKRVGQQEPAIKLPPNLMPPDQYHFYPVWPEPGNKVKYARVSASIGWKMIKPSPAPRIMRSGPSGSDKSKREAVLREVKPSTADSPPPVQIRAANPGSPITLPAINVSRLPPDSAAVQQSENYREIARMREEEGR